MRGLIGDRFLKQFFGGFSHRRRANPAGEAGNVPENSGEKPTEPDCTPREDTPEKEASQVIEKTDEINKLTGQANGSEA